MLPEELAGRTVRRAVVARSLVVAASVRILEDSNPASDAPNSGELVRAILDADKRTGVTILITTHDLNIVEPVSDYVAALVGGRIVGQGDPRDVLDG